MAGLAIRCPACERPLQVPRPLPGPASAEGESVRCPFCLQPILPQARKCRWCHEFLDRDLAIAKAREEEERIKRRVAVEEQESRLAKVSLVCAAMGLVCPLLLPGAMVGILMAIAAYRQIRENPRLKGIGMARTGLALGIISILMWPAIAFFALVRR